MNTESRALHDVSHRSTYGDGLRHRPTETGSVIDLTGDGPVLQPPATGERVRYSFAHLVDAFAAFTAVRNRTGQIVDFRVDYANDAARVVIGGPARNKAGAEPAETLLDRHRRELIDDLRFKVTNEGSVLDAVTLTVGVAVYPDHATEMAGLLRAADEAMYEAKHAGGDRVLVAQTAGNQGSTTPSS